MAAWVAVRESCVVFLAEARVDMAGMDPFPADLAWWRPDPARLRAGGAMALLEVPV
uniref:Uncharacterized protein n=1 Tax=Aegilops tauschii TaxID=37682 RepID=N1R0W5_AEGTA